MQLATEQESPQTQRQCALETVHYLVKFNNMSLFRIQKSIDSGAIQPEYRLRSLRACRDRGELQHIYMFVKRRDRLS